MFWVWKPPDKTQDGKIDAAVRYEILLRKYGTVTIQQFNPPNLAKQSSAKSLGKPNNKPWPLRSCTTPASTVRPNCTDLYG